MLGVVLSSFLGNMSHLNLTEQGRLRVIPILPMRKLRLREGQ